MRLDGWRCLQRVVLELRVLLLGEFFKKKIYFGTQLILVLFQRDHYLIPELVDASDDEYGMYGFESRKEGEDFFIYVTPPDSTISFLRVVICHS